MRRPVQAGSAFALAMFALGSTPAAACGWGGGAVVAAMHMPMAVITGRRPTPPTMPLRPTMRVPPTRTMPLQCTLRRLPTTRHQSTTRLRSTTRVRPSRPICLRATTRLQATTHRPPSVFRIPNVITAGEEAMSLPLIPIRREARCPLLSLAQDGTIPSLPRAARESANLPCPTTGHRGSPLPRPASGGKGTMSHPPPTTAGGRTMSPLHISARPEVTPGGGGSVSQPQVLALACRSSQPAASPSVVSRTSISRRVLHATGRAAAVRRRTAQPAPHRELPPRSSRRRSHTKWPGRLPRAPRRPLRDRPMASSPSIGEGFACAVMAVRSLDR